MAFFVLLLQSIFDVDKSKNEMVCVCVWVRVQVRVCERRKVKESACVCACERRKVKESACVCYEGVRTNDSGNEL